MNSKPVDWAMRAVDFVSAALALVGSISVIALVLVTVVAVVFRYVIGDPIFGIDEVSTMVLPMAVAGSIIYGARIGAHVHVDVLSMVAGRRVTRYTDALVQVLSATIAFLLAVSLWDEAACGRDCGYFTPNLAIQHVPFLLLLAVAMAGYGCLLVLEAIKSLFFFNPDGETGEKS